MRTPWTVLLLVGACASSAGDADCSTEGETRCKGAVLQQCDVSGSQGRFEDLLECQLTCDEWSYPDGGTIAECSCGECRSGEQECDDGVAKVCRLDGDGCGEWHSEDCGAQDARCAVRDDEPHCVPVAASCTREDARRCSAATLQRCAPGPEGKLDWQDWVACDSCERGVTCGESASGPTCLQKDSTAVYSYDVRACAVCDDECRIGSMRCEGSVIQRCQLTGLCTSWVDVETCDAGRCSQPSGWDDEPANEPRCLMDCDECDPRDKNRCASQSSLQGCQQRDDGCWVWQQIDNCAADSSHGVPNVCLYGSDDAERCRCARGVQFCSANSEERLECNGGDGVDLVEDCGDDGKLCLETGPGTSACVDPP